MKKQLRAAERVFIITILITFIVCHWLYAAENTLPGPEEIIAKNIEAMGGKEARKKIKNIKTVTIRKLVQLNQEYKATEYKERPDKYCILHETPEGIIRIGSNGKIAWQNTDNEAHLFEGVQASMFLSATKFDQPDVPYKSMKTEGIEQVNGKDCYKVVKTPEKGPDTIEYYDNKSFLKVKTIDYIKGETGYEEYQKINGILFPYKEVHFSNGQKFEEITYEKIVLNIEMPEGIFDIPEEVKAVMNKNKTEPSITH